MENKKYNSETYKDFTLALALVDSIPVILFAITCAIIASAFKSTIFVLGAILTIAGGLCKVLWKFFLATIKKDIHFLNRPLFIVLMPVGFLLMIAAVILNIGRFSPGYIISAICSFPAIIFFLLGILGLCAMTVFFKKHDKKDAKNNWIEQLTNSFAQAMILIGVILVINS